MNNLTLDDNTKIACICEGASEVAIMNILLDNDLLIFNREHLINGEVLSGRYRKGDYFKTNLLPMIESDCDISRLYIFVIQDTMAQFKVQKWISRKFECVYYFITKPEIEMLMIHSLNLYEEFNKVKSQKKPSIFIGEKLKKRQAEVKSTIYINKFYDKENLVEAIECHDRKCKLSSSTNNNCRTLNDLLKKIYK